MSRNTTAEDHLDLLIELENYLGKALTPYEEFMVGGKTYYLSPGKFLHRKDPGSHAGGYFCGYLDDEVWHHLRNHLQAAKSSSRKFSRRRA
jgi:hypothetical protein